MPNNTIDLLHTHIYTTFIVYRPYHRGISWKYYIMSTVPGSLRRNIAVNMSMLLKHISHCPCMVKLVKHQNKTKNFLSNKGITVIVMTIHERICTYLLTERRLPNSL